MNKANVSYRIMLALFIGSGFAGCSHHHGIFGVDRCADIPAGAIPEPAGSKVCNWTTKQVNNAVADQSVMYRSDFVGDTTELSPAANARVDRIIESGAAGSLQWIVEPTEDSELDLARVEAVAEALRVRGASAIDVIIATPAALGMTGTLAEGIATGIGSNRNTTSNSRSRTSGNVGAGRLGGFRGSF